MRLIDAEDFRKGMYHEAFETDSDLQKWDSGCWIRWKMLENHLQKAPTVDAALVVHGKWTTKRTQKHDGEWYCTVCDYEPIVMTDDMKYCPGCGAKMDAKED